MVGELAALALAIGAGYGVRLWHARPTLTPQTDPASDVRVCPDCESAVTVWHTYGDGSIRCTACRP